MRGAACVWFWLLMGAPALLAQEQPHTGPVDEALVAVEVTPSGKDGTVRRGCGFVLRCDGFVLVPAGLFDPDRPPQSIAVILNPGSARESKIAGVKPPTYFAWQASGCTVLKLDGVHVPALRTRLVTPAEKKLSLVWISWNAATGRYGPPNRVDSALSGPPSEVRTTATPGGIAPLSSPVPAIAPGAVVIGEDGLAVGQVTGGAEGLATAFLSFEELGRVTNCVTPVPTTDEGFRRSEEELPPESRMVEVAGGRIPVPSELLREQPDMNGAAHACAAPFLIDRYEVTNGEYLAFWQSLPETDVSRSLYPQGWAPSKPPFPESLATLPVLGVPLEGARAYARWRGKRLPTPVEWLAAAFGPGGESDVPVWVKRYLSARTAAWTTVRDAHAEFARGFRSALLREFDPAGGESAAMFEIPWITRSEAARPIAEFSKTAVLRETGRLASEWQSPTSLTGRGLRRFDVSPCGARDMILNAAEMFAPSPAPPTKGGLRYWTVDWALARPDSSWSPRSQADIVPAKPARLLSGLTNRSLNRLIGAAYPQERRSGFTLANITYTVSNLQEWASLLAPLSGWTARVGSVIEGRASLKPSTLEAVNRYLSTAARLWTYQRDGFAVWQDKPAGFHSETGRTISLHALDIPIPEPEQGDFVRPADAILTYLLPVGFRCAR